jgi:NAD(P)-dependent dehydrogenase (short-subunit alcohol dehydrogenase family)
LHFARRGTRVYAALRNLAKAGPLEAAARAESLPLQVCPLDVTDAASVTRAVDAIYEREGALDVLVNNAGIGAAAPLEEVAEAEHRAIFETNYWGALRVIQAVLPRMRAARSGAIINVSSIAGRVAFVGQAPYCASKHALEAASEALAQEVFAHGIRVALVEPGVFRTQIWENSEPTTHYDKHSPYKGQMRRNGRLYARLRKDAGDPELVAHAIYEAATGPQRRLRHPVGWDAARLLEGRAQISDEEWVALCADRTDEDYNQIFKRYFGFET